MASKKKRLRKKNRRKVTKKHIKKNKIQYGGGVTVCEALLNRITKDINGEQPFPLTPLFLRKIY